MEYCKACGGYGETLNTINLDSMGEPNYRLTICQVCNGLGQVDSNDEYIDRSCE